MTDAPKDEMGDRYVDVRSARFTDNEPAIIGGWISGETDVMAAPQGNEFWKARSKHGRSPIFATPDDLWAACQEYFAWVETNPLKETQAFAYQGEIKLQEIPKMRAMTVVGLCIFLDIARSTWDEYRTRDGFLEISTRVDEIIRTQKFEGAAAGLLNSSIISRDLGLVEKGEIRQLTTHEEWLDKLEALGA